MPCLFRFPAGLLLSMSLLGLTAQGCTVNVDNSESAEGELGNGRFFYVCVGSTDAACETGSRPETFPEVIAVGGRFVMEYERDEDGEQATVISALPAHLSKDVDVFYMDQPGFVAVLAKLPGGDVIDVKHLRGKTIADLRIEGQQGVVVDELSLEAGETTQLGVSPLDEREFVLAGGLPYQWSSDDETVVELTSVADDDAVRILASGSGQTHVRVRTGEIEAAVPITVTGEGGTGDTSTGDTGTGTDSDPPTDTDTGTDGDTTTDTTTTTTGG